GRDGMLVLIKMQIAFALLLPRAEQAVGGSELGHQKAAGRTVVILQDRWGGSLRLALFMLLGHRHEFARLGYKAGVADEAAENGVGHAGHRRENRGRGNAHAANLDSLRHLRALWHGDGGDRVLPEFMHEQMATSS